MGCASSVWGLLVRVLFVIKGDRVPYLGDIPLRCVGSLVGVKKYFNITTCEWVPF